MLKYALPLTLLPLLTSCVAPSVPPPVAAPAPPTMPRPTPTPMAVVDRYSGDWSVDDLTPGEWRYGRNGGAPRATFTDANGAVQAVIACGNGSISLGRSAVVPADSAVAMRVRTSFAVRDLSIRVDHAAHLVHTSLDVRDPLWDQIAYSRGRFLIEVSFQPPLIVPVRPEISRVIEDCRAR